MAVTTIDDAARAAAAGTLRALPDNGVDSDRVRAILDELALDDLDWRSGRGFSLVYDSPEAHHRLVREVATRFIDENALSHSAFPSAARFEAGVLAMVASVLAPGTKAYGIFASGATESTMVALKAYRDHARYQGANVVVPATAHPAFGKAAEYLDIDLVRVPAGACGAVDPAAVLDAVDGGTVAIGLSAPCYPFGTVDPIAEIAAAAYRAGVPVHVDAALGGLFLPFVDGAPRVGLDVHGVTSVAVDLHKYGYGVKGASALLFARPEFRRAAYHIDLDWPGGAYAASGVLGSRSVAPAAAAFAAMVALGRSGYAAVTHDVMGTARRMQAGLGSLGFDVVGAPAMSVFAVASGSHSVPSVAAALHQRGWRIDVQSDPDAMHFVVFPRHRQVVDEFLADVAWAIEQPRIAGAAGASYGVMLRGVPLTAEAVADDLDRRFDTPPAMGSPA
ncbi:MAG TPA: aminotransferase class V-fold PLP-dependent enzyme [Acidimicrobiia bacterium]|jgi:glutamate/tyrosine decarboxylase-like PLP-dependent enzyme